MTKRVRDIAHRPKNATSEDQSRRLVAAGFGFVKVTMEGHDIVCHPVPLGQLWDEVANLPEWIEIPVGIHSFELVEFLVQTLLDHQSKTKVK